MRQITFALVLSFVPAAAGAFTLLPTEETDHGFTVTVDKQPVPHLGRTVALPRDATLTVTSSDSGPFETALIGPSGIKHGDCVNSWQTRLVQTGGYTLQFGSEMDLSLARLDFVVTDDPDSVARPGEAVSE